MFIYSDGYVKIIQQLTGLWLSCKNLIRLIYHLIISKTLYPPLSFVITLIQTITFSADHPVKYDEIWGFF